MIRALLLAYVLGGLTMVPLMLLFAVAVLIYTSTPVGDSDPTKPVKAKLDSSVANSSDGSTGINEESGLSATKDPPQTAAAGQRAIQGWLIARRTFVEAQLEGSYVNNMVRSFLDARSKDPKRARPRDTFFAVLKGSVLFLYEDEGMDECWAAIEMSSHDVSIYYPASDAGDSVSLTECTPMQDGELFARRNSILLQARPSDEDKVKEKIVSALPSITKDMALGVSSESKAEAEDETRTLADTPQQTPNATDENEAATGKAANQEEAFYQTRPWFLFIKSVSQMEDWFLALQHASTNPPGIPRLTPLLPVFSSTDMDVLVTTLDYQADPIPMRWLNALVGRLFFSIYRTARIEGFFMDRIRRKLAKIKRPSFLTDILVREVSVGSTPPMLSKPMLKELTKEGEASVELGFHYKGEFKIIVEATVIINLGPRFKSYAVKILLAILLKEIDGNLLLRVKSPPSNRIWYAFTSAPKLELEVQPVVSDRQIKWSLILKPIEAMLKDAIQDSVVLPNMDDIPFFDTSDYAIRGGIFSDAKRLEQPANFAEPETPGRVARSRSQKSQSISVPEAGEKQTRIGELVLTGVDRADTTTSLPNLTLGDEAAFLATSTLSNPNRRSAWFSSPKTDPQRPRQDTAGDAGPEDAEVALIGGFEPSSLGAPTPPAVVERGDTRPDDHAAPVAGTPAPQISGEPVPTLTPDRSAPDDALSSVPFPAANISANGSEAKGLRPTSSQSHRSTMSSDISSWLSSRPSTKVDSDGSEDDRPNTTKMGAASTLIANLKTKAAEKQLGATARETMKKWGWGAGSKARGGRPGDDNSKRPSSPPKPTLPKQSYADMRAQVEERRRAELPQQRRASSNISHQAPASQSTESVHASESGTLPTTEALKAPADTASEPIDPRTRTLSDGSSLTRRNSGASSKGYTGGMSPLPSPRLNATSDATLSALSARHISPSPPTTTTEISHLSLTSAPSLPSSAPSATPSLAPGEPVNRRPSTSSNPSLPDVDPSVRARAVSSKSTSGNSPLFAAQPSSAAMMTIPSIHASHRGEIMALGSSPTPVLPLEPPDPPKVVPRLGASIQNVYRMLNVNGIMSSNKVLEPPQAAVTGAASSTSSVSSAIEDGNRPNAKAKPPPLPPRKSTKDLFVQDNSRTNSRTSTTTEHGVPNRKASAAVVGESAIPSETRNIADTGNTIATEPEPLPPNPHDGATYTPPSRETVHEDEDDQSHVDGGSDMGHSTVITYIEPEKLALTATPENAESTHPYPL